MANKKAAQFRSMSDEQLTETLTDLEQSLFRLRFQSSTDRSQTPNEIRVARRDIARVKTLQTQRQPKAEASTS